MSKKNADREKEEEQDLDEDEDEEEEEEEEERPAAATAARGRAHHAHDDHGHDEDEDASDEDDPYWWTPHAVLSVLVLFGVLGFFGIFNNAASKIPFLSKSGGTTVAQEKPAEKPATPAPPTQREEFGAKHLLVQWKGSMRAAPSITRTEEEAKARAIEALKKAKSGVKFEELVKEYSDEPNAAQRGGDLGKFRRGMMDPVFQAAVEKLKVGEVSELVKTRFGYHIILRTL